MPVEADWAGGQVRGTESVETIGPEAESVKTIGPEAKDEWSSTLYSPTRRGRSRSLSELRGRLTKLEPERRKESQSGRYIEGREKSPESRRASE